MTLSPCARHRVLPASYLPSGAIGVDAQGNPTVSTGSLVVILIGSLLVWAVILAGIYYIVRAVF